MLAFYTLLTVLTVSCFGQKHLLNTLNVNELVLNLKRRTLVAFTILT